MISSSASFALFGSKARGTADDRSDLDVIAVLENVALVSKRDLVEHVSTQLCAEVGLSIYSEKRLRFLWAAGSPFAWHLHLQSRPILGAAPAYFFWGEPAEYASAAEDCRTMQRVLESARQRLTEGVVGSPCYEAGLLYVCARNIGMFASRAVAGAFDFSRYAPYALPSPLRLDVDVPIYEKLIASRHASTRGGAVPNLRSEDIEDTADHLCDWAQRIEAAF